MSETLTVGAVSIVLTRRHLRRDGGLSLRTVSGLDSDGNHYSYRKGAAVRSRSLAWKVSSLERDDLLTFVRATAQGARYPVTWTDADAVERTIRFIGEAAWQQLEPDLFLVEIPTEEVVS